MSTNPADARRARVRERERVDQNWFHDSDAIVPAHQLIYHNGARPPMDPDFAEVGFTRDKQKSLMTQMRNAVLTMPEWGGDSEGVPMRHMRVAVTGFDLASGPDRTVIFERAPGINEKVNITASWPPVPGATGYVTLQGSRDAKHWFNIEAKPSAKSMTATQVLARQQEGFARMAPAMAATNAYLKDVQRQLADSIMFGTGMLGSLFGAGRLQDSASVPLMDRKELMGA